MRGWPNITFIQTRQVISDEAESDEAESDIILARLNKSDYSPIPESINCVIRLFPTRNVQAPNITFAGT